MRDPIKVYDARWEANEFSDQQVRRLVEATLLYARDHRVDTVTLTRDCRIGASRLQELAMEECLRQGFRLFLCPDPISTPQSYFASLMVSQEHPRTMGLTITASHNPAQYVGMKFVMPVVQAIGLNCGPEGGLSRIREIYHSGRKAPTLSGGTLRFFHYGTQYIDFSMRQARVEPGMLRGLRVVLDCFNGAAGPEIFSALDLAGVELHPMRLMPDGTFPTGSPSPTSQGKMNGAVELAKSLGGALVVGVDGDGDRIVFGDQRGILSAGFVLLPILRASGIDPKARVPQPVLYDPKVNPLALAEWGKLNVQPVLFRNGHSQIKDYMNSIGALAAGEESGHYYHRIKLGPHTVSVENSILTILLFLASANAQNELLDRLWELQRNIFNTGEFNYQFDSDERRDLAMQRVIDHFTNKGATTVTKTPEGIDLEGTVLSRGVTLSAASVSLDPGWFSGYLRIATNEKSVVRAYFSAGDTDSGRRVEMEARHILEQDFRGRVID